MSPIYMAGRKKWEHEPKSQKTTAVGHLMAMDGYGYLSLQTSGYLILLYLWPSQWVFLRDSSLWFHRPIQPLFTVFGSIPKDRSFENLRV